MHKVSPNDINIEFKAPGRLGIKAKVPSIAKSCLTRHQTLYDGSFAVQGPRLWNCLPGSITNETVFHRFKELVTAFLLSVPDTPPVKGYSCVNSNSLLDWNVTNSNSWSANAMSW